jgi:hypothetical protein
MPIEAAPAPLAPAAVAEAVEGTPVEEDVQFATALNEMKVVDRDLRESEEYGEEEFEEDNEEYEVPTVVVPELRPTAIRFAEDVLPQRPDEAAEAAKKAAPKKARRAPRFAEVEEEEDEIDYSGRIH